MNPDTGIGENRLPEGLIAQMEACPMDSRAPSEALRDDDEDSDKEDLWAAVDGLIEEQENDFFAQDEAALLGAPGPLLDTPATPVVKRSSTQMNPTLSFPRQSVVPSLVSVPSLSPSVSPLKPYPRPLSPMRRIIPDLKVEYQLHVSLPRPHVLLPSRGASLAGQSARANPARESSYRFFASPDQIDALRRPMTWIHGQVISTLGETFCLASRSKPRHEHYDILPTDLFELWTSFIGGHILSRTCLSSHFQQAASPLKCRSWLVPVLLEHHWYLLEFDWIDSDLRIYDSLSMSKTLHPRLVEFGNALLDYIADDFVLRSYEWNVVPEQVSNFIVARLDCDLLFSVAIAKRMTTIAECMCYGIYTASHIMGSFSKDLQKTSRLGVPRFMIGFSCLIHTNADQSGSWRRCQVTNLSLILIRTDPS